MVWQPICELLMMCLAPRLSLLKGCCSIMVLEGTLVLLSSRVTRGIRVQGPANSAVFFGSDFELVLDWLRPVMGIF